MKTLRRSEPTLLYVGALVAALLLFCLVLVLPLPRQVGLLFRYEFSSMLIFTGLMLLIAYSVRGWLGIFISMGVTLVLFALPLSGLWASGNSEPNILLGLLPWSDAANYYIDAGRLLDGGLFSDFSARRPIFAGFLAVLLGVTGRNLQATLALLTLITAVSCFFMARKIQRTHGLFAAVLTLLVLFVFYRRFIGTTLTEHIGLTLGALGLALLWRAGWEGDRWVSALGILLLTLALNARAGPFFILPMLLIWMGWRFRSNKVFSWQSLALGVAAVLLGFGLNFLLLKILATSQSAGFGNFSYTLYGLVTGNKSWTQILIDHPEVNIIGEPEKTQRIYALAFEALRAAPIQFLRSVFAAYASFFDLRNKICGYCFFSGGDLVIFGSVLGGNIIVYIAARIALYVLVLFGFIGAARRWRENNNALILGLCLGILLSIPFVPPWDADRMRAYAAVMPVFAVFPALGLSYLMDFTGCVLVPRLPSLGNLSQQLARMRSLYAPRGKEAFSRQKGTVVLSLALLVVIILGPLGVRWFSHPPGILPSNCATGSDGVTARVDRGSFTNIVANDIDHTWLPNVRDSQFIQSIHNFPEYNLTVELEAQVSPPAALVLTRDLRKDAPLWLVLKETRLVGNPGIMQFCGNPADSPDVAGVGLFYVGPY